MTTPIPIIFFGSDQYSAIVMQHLINSPKVKIANLVTTDTPAFHPLHQLAKTHNIPIILYDSLLRTDHCKLITNAQSIGIVASFGHILPPSVLDLFPSGILCLHPSLLPQYRNTSPVPYAIALGDQVTGITLFQIDNSVDNGKILTQQSEPILPSDTSPILLHRLFSLGAQLTINHLTQPSGPGPACAGRPKGIKSDHPLIFTQKLTTESGHLEWSVVKKLINNQPITQSDTNNELLKLRLSNSPLPTNYCVLLTDLIRALDGWEKVWTILPAQAGATTKKDDLRISISISLSPYSIPNTTYNILISGKPNPISWSDFEKYYL